MQQPTSREMQPLNGSSPQPQIPLPEQHQQHYDTSSTHDDFFDQMLSSLPPWPELSQGGGGGNQKSPWDLSGGAGGGRADESVLLASRLRQHQIGGGGGKPGMGLQPLMLSPMAGSAADSGLIPLPLSLGSGDSSDADAFKSPNTSGGDGLYNGFGASLQRVAAAEAAAAGGQQPFSHPQVGGGQSYGAPASGMGQAQSVSGASGGGTAATGSGTAPPRQRVRARRGQATDPHSIAERLRRERIAERMKALQELVPNANKTDKASMLDEIIDYVKFLQLQVKVLSMSRLGGAAAVAPLVADMSSEGPGGGGGGGRSNAAAGGNDSLTVTEHQVAKLMEEDMGSAMQYLQGKGLCLMPISLASAISTATGHPRSSPPAHHPVAAAVAAAAHHHSDRPPSPSMSVLTVQSAMAAGEGDGSRPSAKDAASISKP